MAKVKRELVTKTTVAIRFSFKGGRETAVLMMQSERNLFPLQTCCVMPNKNPTRDKIEKFTGLFF